MEIRHGSLKENRSHIGIIKRITFLIGLLLIQFALSAAVGETAPQARPANSDWEIEMERHEISVLPSDYSGFQLALCVDHVDLNTTHVDRISEDGRVCYFDLSEEECKQFLQNASPISLGPQGAILWMTQEAERTLIVQHDRTLVLLAQASKRGARDIAGSLKNTLLIKSALALDIIDGDARWSPDGKYLFLNEKGKWFKKYIIDDPYLIDTYTGEIFLIETDGKEKTTDTVYTTQFIDTGRFSIDCSAFWYIVRSGDPKDGIQQVIKRYDLQTSEITEFYRSSESRILDFCEFGENQWLVLESSDYSLKLVRLTVKDDGINIESEKIISDQIHTYGVSLIPINRELALIHSDFYGKLSCLMPVKWNQTEREYNWYIISDLSGQGLRIANEDEIYDLYLKVHDDFDATLNLKKIGTSSVSSLASVEGSSSVIGVLDYVREVPDTWSGMAEELYILFELDIYSMKVRPLISSIEPINNIQDQRLYSSNIALKKYTDVKVYRMSEKDKSIPLLAIRQPSEVLSDNEIYTCSNGTYMCVSTNGKVVLSACYAETKGLNITSSIDCLTDGYRIVSTFIPDEKTSDYSFLVPEAISKDRYAQLAEKMSRATRKKVASHYRLVNLKKLSKQDDKDKLIERYPSLKQQEIYILRENIGEDDLVKLEGYFSEAGYTLKDYQEDLKQISASPFFEQKRHNITYEFSFDEKNTLLRTEVLQLTGLCDKINNAIYRNRFAETEENKQDSIKNKLVQSILEARSKKDNVDGIESIISKQYDLDGSPFSVMVEKVEETNNDGLIVTVYVSRI